MARAKQSRRIARTWATVLGEAAGIDAVDDSLLYCQQENADQGNEAELTRHDLLATIAGHCVSWCEPAINAGAAQIDHCPKGYEDHYYRAYQVGAVARVLKLAD